MGRLCCASTGLLTLIVTAGSVFIAPQALATRPLQIAGDNDQHRERRRLERIKKREDKADKRDQRLKRRRKDIEVFQLRPHRKGFYIGATGRVGATLHSQGFIPSLGQRIEIGAGVTNRITLGFAGGLTRHQGLSKGSAGVIDVVAAGFVRRGLFLRGGLGVTSQAPARDRLARPGVGGLAGIGYEFRPLKHMALWLGADYEGRLRTDGFWSQSVVLNIGIRGYFNKKKW